MAVHSTITLGDNLAKLIVNYIPSNNRITQLEWVIQTGYVAHARFYDIDQSETVPIYDGYHTAGSDVAQIPGQYRLVEEYDPELGAYLVYPPNIRYRFILRAE